MEIFHNDVNADDFPILCDIPIAVSNLKNSKSDITKERYRYFIGKICEREKNNRGAQELVKDIYTRIGRNFGYAKPSVGRLVMYAKAIDRIQRILPGAASDILEGRVRLTFDNTIKLAKMEFPEILAVIERLACEETPSDTIIDEQKAMRKKTERRGRPKQSTLESTKGSVKSTPAYNPDAQINTLIYTIPSWVSVADKVLVNTDFHNTSQIARNKLAAELVRLKIAADKIIALIAEGE